jgi:hypothetical protein
MLLAQEAPAVAIPFQIPMQWLAIAAAALALCLLLGLFLWGIKNPVVWRLLAALGMAVGSGLLVWGIVAAATGEPIPLGPPAGIIGAGAGVMTGAITLLVISFVGRRPS